MTLRYSIYDLLDNSPAPAPTSWPACRRPMLARRPVRQTTDWDRGSPGDPLPGETLQQHDDRARAGGYNQYPRAL